MANIAFDPANAQMVNLMSGSVPVEYGNAILKDVMASSVIMQAGVYEPMAASSKIIDVLTGGPAAYWVDEGERIKTGKPTWKTVTLTAKKLGVILPVSREYLTYKQADFFEIMKPLLAEALYKKFDHAAITGVGTPFSYSIAASLLATNNNIAGDFTAANYTKAVGYLNDNGYEPNAFISKVANASVLRGLIRDQNGMLSSIYDASSKALDGVPVLDLANDVPDFAKGTIIAGDFNQIRYGIPYNMNYMLSQDATLTTITQDGNGGVAGDGDDAVMNLFEREMVALRVTMDVAFMIIDDNAFAQLLSTPLPGSVPKTYIIQPITKTLTAPAAIGAADVQPDKLRLELTTKTVAQNSYAKLTTNSNPVKVLSVKATAVAGFAASDILDFDWTVSPPTVKLTTAIGGAVTDVTAAVKAAGGTDVALADFKIAGGKTIVSDPDDCLLSAEITA